MNEGTALQLHNRQRDKELRLGAHGSAAAPPLPEPLPEGPLWVDGAAPVWLHLTYARWLRARSGRRLLGHWDARPAAGQSEGGRIVFVTGPGAPRCVPKPRPGPA
jgi:hypothetical protein